jgi:hypothetical protein
MILVSVVQYVGQRDIKVIPLPVPEFSLSISKQSHKALVPVQKVPSLVTTILRNNITTVKEG